MMPREVTDFKYDLFVSYAHEDDKDGFVSEQIVRRLRDMFGLSVFFDKDCLKVMDNWDLRLSEGLVYSKMLLVILSPTYFEREYCKQEFVWWLNNEVHRHVLGDGAAPIFIANVPENTLSPSSLAWRKKIQAYQESWDLKDIRLEGLKQLEHKTIESVLTRLKESVEKRLTRLERIKTAKKNSNVPPYNIHFAGRRNDLLNLRKTLVNRSVGAVTALQGIGGIGKSELAFTYANAFAWDYPAGMFYGSCENAKTLAEAILELSIEEKYRDIVFTNKEKTDPRAKARRLLEILKENGKALLILDNVSDPKVLREKEWRLLFSDEFTTSLHVIVTTRLEPDEFSHLKGQTQTLNFLSVEESTDLLNNYREFGSGPEMDKLQETETRVLAGRKKRELSDAEKERLNTVRIQMQELHRQDKEAAEGIAQELGGFTLAVEVVGAYLRAEQTLSYADYYNDLKKSVSKSVETSGDNSKVELSWHEEKNLAALLAPTFKLLSADAMTALRYASLLPPDAVPWPWLWGMTGEQFPEILVVSSDNKLELWDKIMNQLIGLQLLSKGNHPGLARIHRLVAAAVPMDETFREKAKKRIESIVRKLLDQPDVGWYSDDLNWVLPTIHSLVDEKLKIWQSLDDPEKHQLMTDCGKLGDIFTGSGNLRLAGVYRLHALDIARDLLSRAPANDERQQDLALALKRMGDFTQSTGESAKARETFEESLRIWEQLCARDKMNTMWSREFNYCQKKIGEISIASDDMEGFQGVLQTMRRMLIDVNQDEKASTGKVFDLPYFIDQLGDVDDLLQNPARMKKLAEDMNRARLRVVEEDSANEQRQREQAEVYSSNSALSRRMKDSNRSMEEAEKSLQIRRELADDDESNFQLQQDLFDNLIGLGDSCRQVGDMLRARNAYEESMQRSRRLLEKNKSYAQWRRDLTLSLNKIGDICIEMEEYDRAEEVFGESLQIMRQMVENDKSNVLWLRDLVDSLNRSGDLYRVTENFPQSKKKYEESVQIMRQLVEKDPLNSLWLRELNVRLNNLAEVLFLMEDVDHARDTLNESLRIRRQMVENTPSNLQWQHDLASGLIDFGDFIALSSSELGQTRKAFQESLKIRRQMVQESSDPQWQTELASCLEHIAGFFHATNNMSRARKAYRESLQIRSQLAESDPSNAQWQHELAVCLDQYGNFNEAVDDLVHARKYYKKSLRIQRQLVRTHPENINWQIGLVVSLEKIGTRKTLSEALEILHNIYPNRKEWIPVIEEELRKF